MHLRVGPRRELDQDLPQATTYLHPAQPASSAVDPIHHRFSLQVALLLLRPPCCSGSSARLGLYYRCRCRCYRPTSRCRPTSLHRYPHASIPLLSSVCPASFRQPRLLLVFRLHLGLPCRRLCRLLVSLRQEPSPLRDAPLFPSPLSISSGAQVSLLQPTCASSSTRSSRSSRDRRTRS